MRLAVQIMIMSALGGGLACRPTQGSQAASAPVGFRRVVSISPDATEIIGSLGQADKLVAVSTFCLWPPEVKTLPRVGGLFDANAEAILNLRPDLIILRGGNTAVERLANDRHITLFRDRTERFADIYSTIEDLSGLLDCRPRGREVRQEMEAALRQISNSVARSPRPKVLMTLARRPDTLGDIMTANRNTFVNEMIVAAGGENAFAGMSMDYPRLSAEAILAAKPDVIIEAMPESPDSNVAQASALWARLGPIPAVENRRVHILTDENCLVPSPRIVKIVGKIARLLHPEARIG